MTTKLLSGGYVGKFDMLVAKAQRVQIASAWMTDSGALNALLRRKNCAVQAIIGIRGNATSPASLSSLAERFGWESLRVADHAELFHPKLLLFHYRNNPTVAWIGSANFTGHGMGANIELMLQTDDKGAVAQMAAWFRDQWNNLPTDTEKVVATYARKWKEPGKYVGDRGGIPMPAKPPLGPGARVHVVPAERRKYGNLRGELIFGPGDSVPYESAADGLRKYLVRLSDGREDAFLRICRSHPSFQRKVKLDDGSSEVRYYVAKARTLEEAVRNGVYHPDKTVTCLLTLEGSNWKWWISEESNNQAKWDMARVAADAAHIMLDGGALKSWPDRLIE